jgi:two-component system chemotaxis response regulator CheY
MNGVQFLKRIHDDPRLRDVAVVIASTEGSETRIQELLACGARGYLRKPFHPEKLRDVLTPLLGARQASAAAPPGGADDAF